VARFVLLANDFSVFPSVVAEGRRVIANVERVANLFLTKSFYAMSLALATGVGQLPFPFLPRHFTIISTLTIGIPGFFLALAPNSRLARPGFLGRVLRFSIPAGVVAAIATFAAYLVARDGSDDDLAESRTVAVIVLFVVALWVLGFLSRPLTSWRGGLVVAMGLLFVVALAVPFSQDFFALVLPDPMTIAAAVGIGAIAGGLLQVGWHLSGWAPPPANAPHDV
jgi:cation-transporting P-type ATPase E